MNSQTRISDVLLFTVSDFLEKYDVIPGNEEIPEGQVWTKEHTTWVQRKDCYSVYPLHFVRRQLVPSLDVDGYYKVRISDDVKSTYLFLHRIIASVFCDNPDSSSFTQVNHINGVKTDNHIDNLEWCTGSQNCKHAVSHNLRKLGAYRIIDMDTNQVYESSYDVDRLFGKPLEHTRQRLHANKLVCGHNLRLLLDERTFTHHRDRFCKYHQAVVEKSDGTRTLVILD